MIQAQGRQGSCLQHSSLQQRLHIPAAVGNHKNVNALGHDPVNDAIGFEENLAVLSKAYGQQFLRVGASLRIFRKAGKGIFNLFENVVRPARCQTLFSSRVSHQTT